MRVKLYSKGINEMDREHHKVGKEGCALSLKRDRRAWQVQEAFEGGVGISEIRRSEESHTVRGIVSKRGFR